MASPKILSPKTGYQPLGQSEDDQSGKAGGTIASTTFTPPRLRTKADAEPIGSVLIRRNNWVSNLFDTLATTTSALMGMSTKAFSASSPTSELAVDTGTAATNLGMIGSWGFFFSNFFYGLRLLFFGIGKENRAGKIAFGFVNICGLLLAGNTLFVLGMMGFTIAAGVSIAFLALPWIYVVMNLGIMLRKTLSFLRASKGRDPGGLFEQKLEKLKLANESKPFMDLPYLHEMRNQRIARFTLEAELFEYFLRNAFKTLNATTPEELKTIKKEALEKNAVFKKYKENTLSQNDLYDIINKELNGNYAAFIQMVKSGDARYSELAMRYAAGLMVAQQEKYDTRKIFYILGLILSITFITMSILGFIVTGGTAAIPLFALSAIAATALKVSGAALGLSVLACMGGFSIFSVKFAYNEYKAWKEEAEKHPKGDPLHEQWNELLQLQKTSMGLRISGMALFLLSSFLVATAFLPFVNIAVLGFVGMALIAVSAAMFIVGAKKLYDAKQKERALNSLKNNPDSDDPTPSLQQKNEITNPLHQLFHRRRAFSADDTYSCKGEHDVKERGRTFTPAELPFPRTPVSDHLLRRNPVPPGQPSAVVENPLRRRVVKPI